MVVDERARRKGACDRRTAFVIQHPVADFQAWKTAFDSDPVGRARNGVTRHPIYRPADEARILPARPGDLTAPVG
jgi:hypothetical protein